MNADRNQASRPNSADGNGDNRDPSAQGNGGDQDQEFLDEEKALEEPTVSIEDFQALQDELEKAHSQSASNFEGWQRERADFMNYKRRVERDQAQATDNIKGSIIKRFLPVVDDLERALKNRPTQADVSTWVDGIELIYRKLQNLLEAEGLKPVQAEGEQFDPNLMEAISHEPNPNYESGQVIEVVQQGYMLGDRVLRPALVRVAQ